MYSYFTSESQTNFKTTNNMPHFLNRLTDLSYEAKSLYAMLISYINVNRSHEQNKTGSIVKQCGMYKVVDGDNVYVEAARSTIAGIMGKAIGTVRNYINELRLHGLLVDVRVGQGNMNKLFPKYPIDAEYTYIDKKSKHKEMIESLDIENGQEKSDEEAATSTSPQSSQDDTLIQVSSIISQLTDECLSDKECKNLLKSAKGISIDDKLLDLQRAVEDCYGKTPKTSYIRMIFNTLQNRYHIKKTKEPNMEAPASRTKKPKNGFQIDMYRHNWDLEDLEQRASDYMERTLYDNPTDD